MSSVSFRGKDRERAVLLLAGSCEDFGRVDHRTKLSPIVRVLRNIEETEAGCWEWQLSLNHKGYGQFYAGPGRSTSTHKVAYEHFVGKVPNGFQIDHLCRNRACCNPAHLEAVTPRENSHRSEITVAVIHAAKTHCPQGHPYAGANLKVRRDGRRECRTCVRKSSREYQQRKRDELQAAA